MDTPALPASVLRERQTSSSVTARSKIFQRTFWGTTRTRPAVQNPATLRDDSPLFASVDHLRWQGPTERFIAVAERAGDPRLMSRAEKALLAGLSSGGRSEAIIPLRRKGPGASKRGRRSGN